MSDELGALGSATGSIARAQAGIDCSAGQIGAAGTLHNNPACVNNSNSPYSIFSAGSAAGGEVGALGDARARFKWRALRNKKSRIGLALIAVSYTHLPSPRDRTRSRMPSSA